MLIEQNVMQQKLKYSQAYYYYQFSIMASRIISNIQIYYLPPTSQSFDNYIIMSEAVLKPASQGSAEFKINHSKKEVDLQEMKKLILKQITDVTEEDLNVMSKQEITSFYNQLIQGSQQLKETIQQTSIDKSQAQERKEDCRPLEKSLKQNIINRQEQTTATTVKIGQGQYVVPKYLSHQSYQLNNKRFEILCGPPLQSVAEKRQAIIAAYNPAVASTIRALKHQQVLQTYTRLRIPQKKQSYYLKPAMWPQQPKIFCVYMKSQPKDDKFIEFSKRLEDERVQKQKQKAKIMERFKKKKQIMESTTENKSEKNKSQLPRNYSEFDDGFFDEFNDTKEDKGNVKAKTQKKQTKIVPKSDIKQKIEQSKKKLQVENSVQTQKKQNAKKTKTKLTIISQVQYIEETNDQQKEKNDGNTPLTLNQQQQLRPERRVRPFDTDLTEEDLNVAKKMKFADIQKAIFQKSAQPNKIVLDWIGQMKKLVEKLQKQYVSQYQCNWTVISD